MRAGFILPFLLATIGMGAEPLPTRPGPGEARAKLPPALWALTGPNAAPATLDADLVRRAGAAAAPGRLRLQVSAPVSAAMTAALTATGARIIRSSERWRSIAVEATPAQAEAIAGLAGVDGVRLPPPRRHRVASQPGTYVNEADAVLHTDQLRTAHSIDGTGLSIGVISDSIHDTASVGAGTVTGSAPAILTATTPQAGGDLPASIQVVDFGPGGGTDEGEAMLEEIHHLAPAASLAFASGGSDDSEMADNIGLLASQCGCTVITDDLFFYDEPMFQDGPIAQAAAAFVAGGGIYTSAAGNDADRGVFGSYSPVNPSNPDPHTSGYAGNGHSFHNFGGGHPGYLPLTVPGHVTIDVVLQWKQPYKSWGMGAGSSVDFDLYLLKSPSATAYLVPIANQGVSYSLANDPLEIVEWTNPSASAKTIYLAVDLYSGSATGMPFRILVGTNGPSITCGIPGVLTYATVYGHTVATGVISTAAVDVAAPGNLESYSSKGGGWGGVAGMPIYYDTAGTLLGSPDLRQAPILTAPDGVTISTAAQANLGSRFYGTSSAAPHAAAAAALAWQVLGTSTPASQVVDLLTATAVDITASPATTGDDAWSGHGRIDVFAAPRVVVGASPAASNAAAFTFTLTFDQDVTGLAIGDLTLSNCSAAGALSGGPRIYTLPVTASSTGTLGVAVAAGAATGQLGALSAAGSGSATFDQTDPTLGLSAGSAIAGRTCAVTCAFDEPVTGFTTTGMTLDNGTITGLSGNGATWTLSIRPATTGALHLAVPVGTTVDLAGNPLAAGATLDLTVATAPASAGGGSSGGCGLGGIGGLLLGGMLLLAARRRR